MKTPKKSLRSQRLKSKLLAGCGAFFASLLAIPVDAAVSTGFPQHPLQVGTNSVAPNIMFILDDSGSMNFVAMPNEVSRAVDNYLGARRGLEDNPTDRSYVHNTIYYNPNKTYEPWRTSSMDLDARLGDADITNVTNHPSLLSGTGTMFSLVGHDDGVFYVPNRVDPGTTASNYTRYRIQSVGGAPRVVRDATSAIEFSLGSQSVGSITALGSRDVTVTVPAGYTGLQVTHSGANRSRLINLYAPNGANVCSATSSNNSSSCSGSISVAGTYTVRITNFSILNLSQTTVSFSALRNFVEETPFAPNGRSQEDELQNYANWFQYHRTRAKVAKAGASEAFGALDSAYRVGFDTIWNRPGFGSRTANTGGNSPSYPIPLDPATYGAFGGDNRRDWFRHLQQSTASGGTPLHGALQRTGRYYKTADPWRNHEDGDEISCRQSYAILTTDGYWNDSAGYNTSDNSTNPGITIADNDGDDVPQTLADVAMAYYDTDLRPGLGNNVPTSMRNPRNSQHMVTFGVSIGLTGSLPQTTTPANDSHTWPNPWRTSGKDRSRPSNAWGSVSDRRIDDLWHAAVNSKGEFIVANDSEAFANALRRALAQIGERRASGGNIASNGPELTTGSRTYQAVFTTGAWSGDLIAYDISGNQMGQSQVQWRMSERVNNASTNFATRRILTHDGTEGQLFTHAGLSAAQRTALTRATGQVGVVPVTSQNNFDYLIGQRGNEITTGGTGTLRTRQNPVGDIINSAPFYEADTDMLYVGANDGMLHAINASNGNVVFSYVPKGISFEELGKLSDPKYGEHMSNHRFFVDGKIDVSLRSQEAGPTADSDGDQNILVAALGRGGKGIFALDVTTPTTAGMAASKVLWDHTFQPGAEGADNDMGYVFGQMLVRKGENDKTLVIVPNGVDSVSGVAVMYVYMLNANGTLPASGGIVKLRTDAGPSGGVSNGMMNIGVGDLDGNGKIDTLYGGDIKGNLWRWDISSAESGDWSDTRHKMFVATDANGVPQPITGGIALAREPVTRRIFVSFGTGRYIYENDVPSNSDLDNAQVNTVYTLIDNAAYIESDSGVTKVELTKDDLQLRSFQTFGQDSIDRDARSAQPYAVLPSNRKGWYLNLGVPDSARGERVIATPVVYGRALWFTTVIPRRGAGCDEDSTRGYLNAIDVFTGTNPSSDGSIAGTYTFIDVDGNRRGDDRLKDTGADSEAGTRFITSVDVGLGGLGNLRITNQNVCVGGFNADGTCVTTTPPLLGDQAKRMMWREIVENY